MITRNYKTMSCIRCGKEIKKSNWIRKYCNQCRKAVDREQQQRYRNEKK